MLMVNRAFILFLHYTHFTDNLQEKFYASRNTILTDYLFTFPAVIIQPLTGFWLIHEVGYGWADLWLMLTYGIYIIAGACWLPVAWIQIQLKKMIAESLKTRSDLPERYHRLSKSGLFPADPPLSGWSLCSF